MNKIRDKREREKENDTVLSGPGFLASGGKLQRKEMRFKKTLWVILGCIGAGLGAVGAVVPMIPAFPFLLLASVSFGKSSEKLQIWFTGTKIYKNNLESYVKGQGMTWAAKIRVIIMVTILTSIGLAIMFLKEIYVPCMILTVIWAFHIGYFVFGVKTCSPQTKV